MSKSPYPMLKRTFPLPNKIEQSNDGFEIFWRNLTRELKIKQKITAWTKERGNFGEDFEAVYLGGDYIRCTQPSIRFFQSNVSKVDFNVIFEGWKDYVEGKTNKHYLLKSPFAKHVVSIIHQYEKTLTKNELLA
jgi:hypothetical protein